MRCGEVGWGGVDEEGCGVVWMRRGVTRGGVLEEVGLAPEHQVHQLPPVLGPGVTTAGAAACLDSFGANLYLLRTRDLKSLAKTQSSLSCVTLFATALTAASAAATLAASAAASLAASAAAACSPWYNRVTRFLLGVSGTKDIKCTAKSSLIGFMQIIVHLNNLYRVSQKNCLIASCKLIAPVRTLFWRRPEVKIYLF